MAGDYLRIVTVFSFGLFLSISFERMMQATGNTMLSMTTQLTGAVINIILDPIMIFGLLGFPQMGVAGAAAATVIGQIGGMLLGFVLNQLKNHELKVVWRGFRPEASVFRSILAVGFPSIIMQSISSVHERFHESDPHRLRQHRRQCAGRVFQAPVLRVYARIRPGQRPGGIVGYNYGARLRERVYDAIPRSGEAGRPSSWRWLWRRSC